MAANLPLDILVNHIFVRLSVKSILRFRCVCKQWLELLTEPEFIKMHVKDQIHNHQKLVIRITSTYVSTDAVFYSVDPESSEDAVRLPEFPLKDVLVIQTLGSCNGILCMEVEVMRKKEVRNMKNRRLLFGNPSTGDYKMLPESIHPVGPYFLLVGFGYDSSIDDYKLVRVNHITRNPHIFSLKSNSWRTNLGASDNYSIKPERRCTDNVGFEVDGSIYWLVKSSHIIVGFDLKDEEFRELPLPRDMQNVRLSMNVLGGSLCITDLCYNDEVEVWLMLKQEENNKKEYHWNKLMTITVSARDIVALFRIHPLSIMKDGKVLCCFQPFNCKNFHTGNIKFVLIDPKTKRFEDFTIHGIGLNLIKDDTFEQESTYIDSLVSPN